MRIVPVACLLALVSACATPPAPVPMRTDMPAPKENSTVSPESPAAASGGRVDDSEPTFSLEQLPTWPVPETEARGPAMEIYAADVSDELLFTILYDLPAPLLRVGQRQLVSGRIQASQGQALEALITANPQLRALPLPQASKKYRGRKVDLHFHKADSKNVLKLIAEVSGININAPQDLSSTLTILVRGMPWDQLLDLTAGALGLSIHAPEAQTRFLSRGDYKLDRKLVKQGKGWIDLRASDVSASVLASNIAAVSGLKYSLPCDARSISLDLRRSKAGTAFAAIELAAGSKLSPQLGSCPNAPTELARPLQADDRLLATIFTGNRRRVLIQSAVGKTFFSEDAKALQISPALIRQGDVTLSSDSETPEVHDLRGARLAATLVQGEGAGTAILQLKNGSFRSYSTAAPEPKLELSSGKVTIRSEGLPATTLTLRPKQ